jgi:hypothetical protein
MYGLHGMRMRYYATPGIMVTDMHANTTVTYYSHGALYSCCGVMVISGHERLHYVYYLYCLIYKLCGLCLPPKYICHSETALIRVRVQTLAQAQCGGVLLLPPSCEILCYNYPRNQRGTCIYTCVNAFFEWRLHITRIM